MKVHNSCLCARLPRKLWESMFNQLPDKKTWNLLKLKSIAAAGNGVEAIGESIPFRNDRCVRSMRCCGQCTIRCANRCVQDSLHRVYLWRQMYESMDEETRKNLPLGIRMAATQEFTSAEQLSYVVGEILSVASNPELKQYMQDAGMRADEHPYKMDYAQTYEYDSVTGKRVVNPMTGDLRLVAWPESGLCPYCIPHVVIDRRYKRGRLR